MLCPHLQVSCLHPIPVTLQTGAQGLPGTASDLVSTFFSIPANFITKGAEIGPAYQLFLLTLKTVLNL